MRAWLRSPVGLFVSMMVLLVITISAVIHGNALTAALGGFSTAGWLDMWVRATSKVIR